MRVTRDISGQVFEKLTVIRLLDKDDRLIKNKANWLCVCECGEERVTTTSALLQGRAKSCGCIRNPDITGKKFGRLTPIERVPDKQRGLTRWKCLCNCGNYHEVSLKDLSRGNVKSCGCITSQDLIGKVFGMLTVKADTGERDNERRKLWLCDCECGTEYKVRTDSLTTGNTTSCGCLTGSKGEKYIKAWLLEKGIPFKQEYTFTDLLHKRPLRYDFAILDREENIKLLIEFDGRQHETMTGYFGGIEEFEKYQERDKLKNEYCIDNQLPLLRIPYTDYDKLDGILSSALEG